ncbi:MAG: 2OG-Fe(II) oxygenase [Allosphingosinicella sp.]|uniref:2OG-Fe(II) oxygenase n=1 Tax=Allosphingosinicella sp. TaxID=2823234 RepID=UPI0039403EB8
MRPSHWDCGDAFSAAECAAIVALGEAAGMRPAPVWGGHAYVVVPAARDVAMVHCPRAAATEWIYARLDALFAEAARRLELEGQVRPVDEPMQLLRYDAGCHFQSWHSDAGLDLIDTRRVSVSVELSDACDYEGGDLEIMAGPAGRTRAPRKGAARFFRSSTFHRVTPVTSGVRHALAIWTG